MNVALLTNEYPPYTYGGAGVHIEYLSRALEKLCREDDHIHLLCFGDQHMDHGSLQVEGIKQDLSLKYQDPRHQRLFDTLASNLIMAGSLNNTDIVHCHTWYTHFAGCLTKQLLGSKLILTTHSLEVHRPWKAEQLGSAYQSSSWIEKTAYQYADGVIAVSESMKRDVHEHYGVDENKIRVIHNGIDIDHYCPKPNKEVLRLYGIDEKLPFILLVGRVTRQKGIIHLVNAIKYLDPGLQIVICAGAPDTNEIKLEMEEKIAMAKSNSSNPIIWINKILPKQDLVHLYTHAHIFVCPSVYEPFGIINLEAMACKTPVVATRVGGIPEVVEEGVTGRLVSFEKTGSGEPRDPEVFSRDLARVINGLMLQPDIVAAMGEKSFQKVVQSFSWEHIAQETYSFYRRLNPVETSMH